MRRGAALAVACVLLWAHAATAALMSIDLGSEFLKVCLVQPGRTPISIAVNEMSKRKSPALVGIVNGERLLGEEAYSFAVRYPEAIFQRARDLLGKDPDDPTIAAILEEHRLPYKVVAHPKRGVASLQLGDGATYSPEELVGSILYYARQVAEAQAGTPVLDAVIAVPAFFGQRQRQAIADAASLAGLNLMGLINTHTAAALQYGIERDFSNRSQTIILYDMGSGTTEVALVKYSTYTVKEAGKPKVYNQLEVKDVDWDDSLGSNLLDMALARHFAAEFAAKEAARAGGKEGAGVDVLALPKAMSKLRRQVRRTKEMLSANSAAPCTVEELYDGRDFQSSITREAFESLASDFFARAAAPLQRLLQRNGLSPADIDAVELLGGGSRVPRLQAALSEVLGGRGLDRHLDADEATALGAGLFAANLSTSFRLRKFGMVDATMYGISLSLDHVVMGAAGAEAGAEAGAAAAVEVAADGEKEAPFLKVRNLLPYMKKLPTKRLVKLEGLAADPLRFSLSYNASTPHGLPPGVREPLLAEWEATGLDAVVQRYNTSGQVSLRFDAEVSGLLRLDRLEAVVEYTVLEEKLVELPAEGQQGKPEADSGTKAEGEDAAAAADQADQAGKEEGEAKDAGKGAEAGDAEADEEDGGADNGSNGEEEKKEEEGGKDGEKAAEGASEAPAAAAAAAAADAATNATETNATKPATVTQRIQVPKTKVAKVILTVGGRGWVAPALTGDDLAASRALLSGFEAAEAVKRDVARSRNDLESYIIALKEALETDELVMKVSTESQRESFRSQLSAEEDWLYMEAEEGEGAQQFKDRLKQLKEIGEPIKRRAEELELRPKVVAGLRSQLELRRATARAWPETKPWITDAEREEVEKQLADLEADLEAKVAAQSGRADHEEPAFAVSDLATAWERLDKAFNKVNNKKKPKPPPEAPKPAEGETAEAAGADKAGDNNGGEAKPEAADPAGGAKDANGSGSKQQEATNGKEQPKKEDEKPKAEEPKKESKPKQDAKKEQAKKDNGKAKKEEPKKEAKKDTKKDGKADAKKDTKKDAKKDTKKEAPKKDTKKDAKKEAPKKEAPKKEAPKKEAPKKEAPKKEAPKKEEPKDNSKGAEKDEKKNWSWNKKGKGEEL